MKPLEYLKGKLTELAINFPLITVKYAYDKLINYHVIELTPIEEFYNNEKLDDFWIPVSIEFSDLFPDEYVTFISNDSSLKIEKPELIFNDKQLSHIDIEEIFNEILNAPIDINYTTTFESIHSKSIHISYNQTQFSSIKIPTQNEIINFNSQQTLQIKQEIIFTDCELSQAA